VCYKVIDVSERRALAIVRVSEKAGANRRSVNRIHVRNEQDLIASFPCPRIGVKLLRDAKRQVAR
jgi:hypothetical protein